jgi:hypothetical protein
VAELKLVDENYTEADIAAAITDARAKAATTHPHAKRFEVVSTAAGPIVLCNASRAQVHASDSTIAISGDMKMSAMNRAREGLFLAMCVVPDVAGAKALIEDWPELTKDGDLVAAMERLNGSRKK